MPLPLPIVITAQPQLTSHIFSILMKIFAYRDMHECITEWISRSWEAPQVTKVRHLTLNTSLLAAHLEFYTMQWV